MGTSPFELSVYGASATIVDANMPNTIRYGMALMYTSIGFDPVVYLLTTSGRKICKGTIGMASNANLSFGSPASTNFNDVTESHAANVNFTVNKIAAKILIGRMLTIRQSNLYVSTIFNSSSLSSPLSLADGFRSVFNTATKVVVTKKQRPQNQRKPA